MNVGVDQRPSIPSARKEQALEIFSGLSGHYDRLSSLLSLGQDPRWRRAMVAAVRASPDDRVLDVATGTGLVATALVRRYGCSVVGLDQSEQMLASARAKLAREPELAEKIQLVRGEAERLPFADCAFDAVTFTYLLRYVDDPGATMRELARVVKPGGRIASLEFAVPASALARASWILYTRLVLPAVGRLVSRDWYEVGRFLGPNISRFYRSHPLSRIAELWQEAEIERVQIRSMSLGGGVVMHGVKGDGR